MVKMVGPQGFATKLGSTLQGLATDESHRVRHTVASGYHEVVLLLGNNSMSVVGVYQKLLSSGSVEVSTHARTHTHTHTYTHTHTHTHTRTHIHTHRWRATSLKERWWRTLSWTMSENS